MTIDTYPTVNGTGRTPATGRLDPAATDLQRGLLLDPDRPCYAAEHGGRQVLAGGSGPGAATPPAGAVAVSPAVGPASLGDPAFGQAHGLGLSYMSGAMAGGIASAELVIALGQAGLLGSFGAAGLVPERIEDALSRIQTALPNGPYAVNLIHSPSEEALERGAVDLLLRYGVRTVEASAFLALTPHIVRYRAAGLSLGPDGRLVRGNRVVAKVSRREVAEQFMRPAPDRLLDQLQADGLISAEQARLARQVPVADDITVEADSGGHTDNRPLVCLLPSIIALRDELQATYGFDPEIRVGAAGGIGTPSAVLAAFTMGAAYVVTGSVNQGCVESGTSDHVRQLLAEAEMADVIMAPAADMFELGVKLQVLKRGTLFPMRSQKLRDLYVQCAGLDDIPGPARKQLEEQLFRRSLDDVWQDTANYFAERDPAQLERAEGNPKRKMALVFRWYLGLSSRWASSGDPDRAMDYQIWCGPAMGAFNDWARGSYLEAPQQRRAADVARHLMTGAAYLARVRALELQGVRLPPGLREYRPQVPAAGPAPKGAQLPGAPAAGEPTPQ